MTNKYFTVVFEIDDLEKFKPEAARFTSAMCGNTEFPGATVTGAGWEDSMTERDNMGEFLSLNDFDVDSIARGEDQ